MYRGTQPAPKFKKKPLTWQDVWFPTAQYARIKSDGGANGPVIIASEVMISDTLMPNIIRWYGDEQIVLLPDFSTDFAIIRALVEDDASEMVAKNIWHTAYTFHSKEGSMLCLKLS